MPTYRIYYAEREVRDPHFLPDFLGSSRRIDDIEVVAESDWEEEVDADSEPKALEEFFRGHAGGRSHVLWVDDDGRGQEIHGIGEWDPQLTYVWIEEGKLMEYQGMDEATPGMVTCPLCDGAGEVGEEVAEQFLAEQGEEVADGDAASNPR